ncbi:NifU family protein [Kocuria tytonis]|uniref:NifU family protein n=1 Tax=Kocuria tytonis TaxID=2054280 RepID=A0A495A577_9MICC|nr:NifU family protein [Kocuria tytonis]RKQ34958.1 NifU family protein [Kocuria tytonis]
MNPAGTALHPEVQKDRAVARWILTGRSDSFADASEHPGEALARLLAEDVLVAVAGGVGWIDTTLAPGRTWQEAAGEVRSAVTEHVAGAVPHELTTEDLRRLAHTVLKRDVAPIAGAHGGRIEISAVEGHTVTVVLEGACHGCPAAKTTLQDRFRTALRQWDPQADVVEAGRSAATAAPTGGRSWLPFPGRIRRARDA